MASQLTALNQRQAINSQFLGSLHSVLRPHHPVNLFAKSRATANPYLSRHSPLVTCSLPHPNLETFSSVISSSLSATADPASLQEPNGISSIISHLPADVSAALHEPGVLSSLLDYLSSEDFARFPAEISSHFLAHGVPSQSTAEAITKQMVLGVGVGLPCHFMECGDVIYR